MRPFLHSDIGPRISRQFKARLRCMAPRYFNAIVDAIKIILEKFKPAECGNYLKNSGHIQF